MNGQPSIPTSTRVIYAVFDFFGSHRKQILAGLAAVVVLGVLATGVYIVKKEERGVRTRFGRVVDAEIGPGMGYRIPFIERVHIRKVKRIVGYRISSRDSDTINFTVLSGDTNLLEVDVALQYRIGNLRQYLFASADPRTLLTMLVREELINILGQHFIDLIFTSNRNLIQQHLIEMVVERLDALEVGVELVALKIVNVRPIPETLDAFRDVNDAIAEREQAVSEANRKRERMIARSKGQAVALIMNARASARERVVQARSSAGVFRALLAEYRKRPQQVAITRYWQRMRAIFTEASLSMVNPGRPSTIDINMIDGVAGFTPAHASLEAPPSDSAVMEGRLPSSTVPPDIHALENVGEDRLLREGQFHRERTERDHQKGANPRSLIFDTPSIFSHRHVKGRQDSGKQQGSQKPMTELIAEEGAEDGEPGKGK